MNLEEEILKKLTSGTKLCDVYEAGVAFIKKEKPALLENVTKNFGFATGLVFKESSLMIGPKTTLIAKKGMVFSVNIGISNLTNKEATEKEGKIYALFLGDTVVVNDGQPATTLTISKKKIQNIG